MKITASQLHTAILNHSRPGRTQGGRVFDALQHVLKSETRLAGRASECAEEARHQREVTFES